MTPRLATLAIADPSSPSAGKPIFPNTSSQLPAMPTSSDRPVTTKAQPGRPSAAAAVRITPAPTPGSTANAMMSMNRPARRATSGFWPASNISVSPCARISTTGIVPSTPSHSAMRTERRTSRTA